MAEQFRAHDKRLGDTRADDQLAHDQSGADRFPEADIVGQQGHRQAATEGNKVADLMAVRF